MADTVQFGASQATGVTVISSSNITCTAPTGTAGTSVNVTVTTAGGVSNTVPYFYEGPFGGTAPTLPATIICSAYDTGGQGVAYNQVTNGGQSAASGYRSDGFNNLKANSDSFSANPWVVGYLGTGAWYNYIVNCTSAGVYSFALRAGLTVGNPPNHISLSIDGSALPYGVVYPGTDTWNTAGSWSTVPLGAANITTGLHVLQLFVLSSTGGPDLNELLITSGGIVLPAMTIGFATGITGAPITNPSYIPGAWDSIVTTWDSSNTTWDAAPGGGAVWDSTVVTWDSSVYVWDSSATSSSLSLPATTIAWHAGLSSAPLKLLVNSTNIAWKLGISNAVLINGSGGALFLSPMNLAWKAGISVSGAGLYQKIVLAPTVLGYHIGITPPLKAILATTKLACLIGITNAVLVRGAGGALTFSPVTIGYKVGVSAAPLKWQLPASVLGWSMRISSVFLAGVPVVFFPITLRWRAGISTQGLTIFISTIFLGPTGWYAVQSIQGTYFAFYLVTGQDYDHAFNFSQGPYANRPAAEAAVATILGQL